jgi:hypothetical protein
MKLTPSIQQMIDEAPGPIESRHFLRRLMEWMNGAPFGNPATQVMSTALETSHVLKNSAGKLHALTIFNSKASAQFILIINAASVPSNGAVTLLYPPVPVAAGSVTAIDFPRPVVAGAGIVVCNSSTGSFTQTLGSADCAFFAHITD